MKSELTLVLHFNYRGFGFALFEDPKTPLDCGLVTIRPISNRDCLNRIQKIIEYYRPSLVILQDLEGKHSFKCN